MTRQHPNPFQHTEHPPTLQETPIPLTCGENEQQFAQKSASGGAGDADCRVDGDGEGGEREFVF